MVSYQSRFQKGNTTETTLRQLVIQKIKCQIIAQKQKFKKTLKKCLTELKQYDIINELSARDKLLTTNDRNLDN